MADADVLPSFDRRWWLYSGLGAGGATEALLADATSGLVAGSLGSDLTTAWGAATHPAAIGYVVPSLAGGLVRVDVQE
mgnify:CR=1 FL=1